MVIGIIVVSIPLCIGAYVAYRLGTARVEGPDDPPQERSTTTGGIVYSGSFNPVHAGHLAVLRHMVQIPCTLLPGTLLLCALLPCTLLPCTLLPCTLLLCALLPCTLLFCTLLPCTLLPCALLLCALFQALHVLQVQHNPNHTVYAVIGANPNKVSAPRRCQSSHRSQLLPVVQWFSGFVASHLRLLLSVALAVVAAVTL
jgi:hypothetical protein